MGPELLLLMLLGGGVAFGFGVSAEMGDEAEAEGESLTADEPHDAQFHIPPKLWAADSLTTDGAEHGSLTLGADHDLALSGSGDDLIHGGAGNDRLLGEAGADLVRGGSGDDVILDGVYDRTDLNGSELRLWIDRLTQDAYLYGDDDSFFGDAGADLIDSRIGADLLFGGSGDDVLFAPDMGTPGADALFGGAGNDTLSGDHGDYLSGGAGVDHFIVDNSYNPLALQENAVVVLTDFDTENETLTLRDERATVSAFDPNGPREAEAETETGTLRAIEGEDHVTLWLSHLDGSETEMVRLRFVTLADVAAAIEAGRITTFA